MKQVQEVKSSPTPNLDRNPNTNPIRGDYEKWSELDVEMCLKWRQMRKPLICGVSGYVVYHGTALMSCADIVIASSDVKCH